MRSVSVADAQPVNRRSRWITAFAWLIAIFLVPACCGWMVGRWVYWFDVVASEQMVLSWIALVLWLIVLATRRWVASVVCALMVCASFYPLVTGRVWSLPAANLASKTDGLVRVVSCNLNPENTQWDESLKVLTALDADVIVLIEVPIDLNRSIRNSGLLSETNYPYWIHRFGVHDEASPGFIISRFPVEQVDINAIASSIEHSLYGKIKINNATVVIGMLHPPSPRSPKRWDQGNGEIETQMIASKIAQGDPGFPIIIGADLNAGYAQTRGVTMRSSGFKQSKPLLRFGGSYPANNRAFKALMVQIDDLWTRGSVEPVAWSAITVPGSDHLGIVVDFQIDPSVD